MGNRKSGKQLFPPLFSDLDESDPFISAQVYRQDLLKQIHHALSEPPGSSVLLVGLPGIGKTTLLRQYIYRRSSDFHGVSYISAHQFLSPPLTADFDQIVAMRSFFKRQIAQSYGVPTPDEFAWDQFSKHIPSSHCHLFVIDDFDALPDILRMGVFELPLALSLRFAVLAAARRFSTTHLPPSLDLSHYSLRLIEVPPPSYYDLIEIVNRRIKLSFGREEERLVMEFFVGLRSRQISINSLSPRFAFQALNAYSRLGDLDQALIAASRDYFPKISALAITESADGLLALPMTDMAPAGLRAPTGSIFTGVPLIVVHGANNLWRRQIEEFEELIRNSKIKEGALQAFFERNRHFLQGLRYSKVYPQVVLERDDEGGNLKPDFLLRPLASPYVDVLDLKLPTKRLVVGRKDRKHFSGEVESAIAQVREYRDYFERPEYRDRLLTKYGITGYRPKCIVVIGTRPSDIPEEKMRQLLDGTPRHLEIMTYDDLLGRMKALSDKHLA